MIFMIQPLVDRVELPVLYVNLVQAVEDHLELCYCQIVDKSLANKAVEALHKCIKQLLLGFDSKPISPKNVIMLNHKV